MRVRAEIRVTPEEATPGLIEALRRVCPPKDHYPSFNCEEDEASPVTQRVLALLHEHGYVRWTDKSRPPVPYREYSLRRVRVYDQSDLESAEFVTPEFTDSDLLEASRDDQKRLYLNHCCLRGKRGLLSFAGFSLVCCRMTKQLLESTRLHGLVFREAVPATGPYPKRGARAIPDHEPWWEIIGEQTLPPLSPHVRKLTARGKTFPREFPHPIALSDGDFFGWELHYCRSELAALPKFDVAMTYEYFLGDPLKRARICSNRFWRICQEHELYPSWKPVRIEDC